MISKKAAVALLAGASVASLAIAGGSALAGQTFSGPFPAGLAIVTDTNFVILDNTFVSGADVTNSASIGPGNIDSIGFLVQDGAVINGALINTALASITAFDFSSSGSATATALRIDGTVPEVVNHGLISASAISSATLGGSTAYAEARGVEYDGTGVADGITSLWNDGEVVAYANAFASDTSGASATALAIGVDEYATGSGGGIGTSATTIVSNDGLISADADATAVAFGAGVGTAFASASARGVDQVARSAEWTVASLDNTGEIIADAFASAFASGTHYAFASANAVGVTQNASATGSSTSIANAAVDNIGTITAAGFADASATSSWATAFANATGVLQQAQNAEVAAALVTNTGDVHAIATAYADAHASLQGRYAWATANAVGVEQRASANFTTGSVASATVTNESLYSIDALANAYAFGSGSASAYASNVSATGVFQRAVSAEDATALVVNAGSISADANAIATATFDFAYASAYAAGVNQIASGTNGEASSATATIINDGSITASANADASAWSSNATASAFATGIFQRARNAEDTIALVANTGDIHATATADAVASSYAYASAYAAGVNQGATANGTSGSFASATVTNESLLSIDALANAFAFGSSATASASATGVFQRAQNAEDATALVDNTGSISAEANAIATATFESAYASAYAAGINQRAAGTNGDASSATATVYNDGSITAAGFAFASATFSSATASAFASGVFQRAQNAEVATALVSNTGDIHATATASAVAFDYASVSAYAAGVFQQATANFSSGSLASATVTNESLYSIDALANAFAFGSSASASASATGVNQRAQNAEDATALVSNGGSITAAANAIAIATSSFGFAYASAFAAGINQRAVGTNGDASSAIATVINDGSITASALADVSALLSSASASAFATGVLQRARNAEVATALVTNTGDIHAVATADANAFWSASATASAFGVNQGASGNNSAGSVAGATVTNESLLSIDALANAFAFGSSASAQAFATGAVRQFAIFAEDVTVLVDNGGSISAEANASATATLNFAYASANATGVRQRATATSADNTTSATATVINDGSIIASANAFASALSSSASAYAFATGVDQRARNAEVATALVSNTGDIHATATADAVASEFAYASVFAAGVLQTATANSSVGSIASATVTNESLLSIDAIGNAYASGSSASAYAFATGVFQGVFNAATASALADNNGSILAVAYAGAIAAFTAYASASANGIRQNAFNDGTFAAHMYNTGDIVVDATAIAAGGAFASASAFAYGYVVSAGSEFLNLDVINDGDIDVQALADATDSAFASAIGIYASGFEKTGWIVNNGSITVRAFADAVTGTASAFGIWDPSTETNVAITNTGLISAYAEGPNAFATGILINSFGGQALDPALATIANNGGTIIAAISEDGGATIQRGNAINTEGAPNPVLIELTGNNGDSFADGFIPREDGYIFGNIEISDDDAIVVFDGKTWFDGIINPDFVNEGSLDIVDEGNILFLNREQGPSAAFVDSLFIDDTGTFGIEVNAANTDPFNDYPFIDANTATVNGGTLNVVYQPDFYDDAFTYEGVIRSGDLTGNFDFVTDNSALLNTVAVVNGDDIDVEVDRIAFGDVFGLTKNQQSVGDAIENVFDVTDPDTDFGNLVAHLFTFDDGEYSNQLNSLAGAEYAQYLQSVIWSTSQLNRTVTQRMECDGAWAANMQTASLGGQTIQPVADVAPIGCFRPGRVSLWADVSGSWNEQDGDKNAPGYDEDQYAFLVGADYAFDESFYMGIAVGYLDSDMDFKRFGNKIDYDGLQLALYGGYDDTENYIRGILSYGTYDGSSHRFVSIEPSNPIDPSGNPDSDVFSFYGELGHRFGMGVETNVTPFAGLSLAQGEIDGFTESDPQGTGAGLHIHGSDGNSAASLLGVRLGGDWMFGDGMFTPDISVAWMHEFDEERQTVKASFADAPSGADFKVVGSKTARDSAVINVGGTFGLSEGVDFSVIYDGRYSSDYSASALIGRVGWKF